jgi:tetratricopeptide (TPR) repeat protein
VASTRNYLGMAVEQLGDYAGAADYFRRALAIKERIAGSDAAWIATTVNNLGRVQATRGELDEAEALHQRALSIRTRLFGPDHVVVAGSLGQLAEVRRKQRRYDEALDLLDRALAIETKTYGPTHPAIPERLISIADVLDSKGDVAGAADAYRRALEGNKRALGPEHPYTVRTMSFVAMELVRLRRCGEARPLLDAATAALEKSLGADSVYVGEALAESANCDLAEGHPVQAAARLERAIAIEQKASDFLVDRGHYRWQLARALWALGRRDEAVAAARLAEHELGGDADAEADRAAARAWLAKHG